MNKFKLLIEKLLQEADIELNGNRKGDIIVYNEDFYKTVVLGGTLALGETYMKKWWDCENLDFFFYKLVSNREKIEQEIRNEIMNNPIKYFFKNYKILLHLFLTKIMNFQTQTKSNEVIDKHYQIGDDLYKIMLDETLTYTCAYWKEADSLKKAQEQKYELICKKLKLKRGMSILDIGCGYGGFAYYASKHYGVEVYGVTLSQNQANIAMEKCKDLKVKIEVKDYRDVKGEFDRILSIGMIEHVGYKNYKSYMSIINNLLKKDGISLVHTIGIINSVTSVDPWFEKYIFPNGMLPSIAQLSSSMEDFKFVIEDVENFGWSYDLTLLEWNKNFVQNWKQIENNYSDEFYRMWQYYLLSSAGFFRSRQIHLWQIVFTKKQNPNIYESVRL